MEKKSVLDVLVENEVRSLPSGSGQTVLYIRSDTNTKTLCGSIFGNSGQMSESILMTMKNDSKFADTVRDACIAYTLEKISEVGSEIKKSKEN